MQKNDLSVKEAIISTTKELLIKKGNITIKDIAEAAYVNVAAINYHFGSKDNLIQIVTQRVVKDLRTKIVEQINAIDQSNYDFEEIIMIMIEIIFSFAEENLGLINYSFLQLATQSHANNVLVELFILDKTFINMVMEKLALVVPNASEETLFSKYLILFSSFVIPFFLSFTGIYRLLDIGEAKEEKSFFAKYRTHYLAELRKVLNS